MKKQLFALALAASVAIPNTARATGIPTVDVAAILQSIIEWTTQIEELNEAISQVQELENQLAQAEEAYNAVNGLRDVGNLLNSDLYNDARNYLPTNWQETLALGGDFSNGRYSSLFDYIEAIRSAGRLYDAELLGGADSQAYKTWNEDDTYLANEVGASKITQDVVGARYAELAQLKTQLTGMADAKSVQDLQANAAIEQLMLQNEMIGMLARQQEFEANRERLQSQRRSEVLAASHRTFDAEALVEELKQQQAQ